MFINYLIVFLLFNIFLGPTNQDVFQKLYKDHMNRT